MTVGELLALLAQEDPDRVVVLSIDPEGNGFNELSGVEASMYDPKRGEVGPEELTEDLVGIGFSNEDIMKNGTKAVVLWPSSWR